MYRIQQVFILCVLLSPRVYNSIGQDEEVEQGSSGSTNSSFQSVVSKVIAERRKKSWSELETSIREIEDVVEFNLKTASRGGVVGRLRLWLLREEIGDALALTNPSLLDVTRRSLLALLDGIAEWFVVIFGVAHFTALLLRPFIYTRRGRSLFGLGVAAVLITLAFSMAEAAGLTLPSRVEEMIRFVATTTHVIVAKFQHLCTVLGAHGFDFEAFKGVAEVIGIFNLAVFAGPHLVAVVISPQPPPPPPSTENTPQRVSTPGASPSGGLWASYAELLRAHPMLVGFPQQGFIVGCANAATQALVFGFSSWGRPTGAGGTHVPNSCEVVARTLGAEPLCHWVSEFFYAELDLGAVGRAALMGGAGLAPLLHLWYLVMNTKILPSSTAGVSKSSIPLWLKRTLLDQLVMAWFFNAWAQFLLAALAGEPFAYSRQQVSLVFLSWVWWLPVKGLIFGFAPEHFWLPLSALGSFGWNIIMFAFVAR